MTTTSLTHDSPTLPAPAAVRPVLLGALHGKVLEIGPGAGVNLRHYRPDVRWLGVEPDPSHRRQVRREAERLRRPVQLLAGRAEQLPLPGRSVDAVVGTLVLCSVEAVDKTLAEVRRVLRPGGPYVFVEHVAAPPGTWTRRGQTAYSTVAGLLGAGCRSDRDSEHAIARAGFDDVDVRRYARPGPLGVDVPHIAGVAR